jgi:Flp pilus assembly pilin Flp
MRPVCGFRRTAQGGLKAVYGLLNNMGAPDPSATGKPLARARRWLRRKGQSMVEFALIIVLVAVIAITAVTVAGNQLVLSYQDIQEALANPGDPGGTAPYTCPDGSLAVQHGHKYHCH